MGRIIAFCFSNTRDVAVELVNLTSWDKSSGDSHEGENAIAWPGSMRRLGAGLHVIRGNQGRFDFRC